MFPPRLLQPGLALVLILSCGSTAFAQVNDEGKSFPRLSLSKTAKGTDILTTLGTTQTKNVAAWYGHSEAKFKELCNRDRSLGMDRKGHLVYACAGKSVFGTAAELATSSTGGSAQSAATVSSDPFLLHSKPGATKVIYLDFDGNTTTGTSWNESFTTGANIITPAYDTDGTPSSFSATELANIQQIWQMVAEDYAPFDVDVTTQDPGIEALRKTSSTDLYFGIRMCIGGSSLDWMGASAGGIAYLNSFVWDSDTPAFVFPAQLGNGAVKYVAEAVSHESGHTFGLNHDGQTTGVEYYAGHANWAPIMGVGYYKDVTQWSKGEYPSANNLQDDVAVIAGICPLRADQYGNDIIQAAKLTGTSIAADGLIESSADADLFGFTTGAGTISLAVNVATPSPNLDVLLGLYDGVGNLVTSVAPTTMGATLTATVAQGTYYIAVEGGGTGSPTTAYNDYASIGQYSLTGTVISTTAKAPVAVTTNSTPMTGLAPLNVSFSSVGSSDPDGTISRYDWDFGNGITSTAAHPPYTDSTPGTYKASLVVVDNSGIASSPSTVTIVVQSASQIYVANIAMTVVNTTKGYQATANVTIKDLAGKVKPGATVTSQFSGLTTGSSSKVTSKTGVATFTSSLTKSRGTFTFTVTNVTLTGFVYAPTRNLETSDAIATP